jgi:hypothetical protein
MSRHPPPYQNPNSSRSRADLRNPIVARRLDLVPRPSRSPPHAALDPSRQSGTRHASPAPAHRSTHPGFVGDDVGAAGGGGGNGCEAARLRGDSRSGWFADKLMPLVIAFGGSSCGSFLVCGVSRSPNPIRQTLLS